MAMRAGPPGRNVTTPRNIATCHSISRDWPSNEISLTADGRMHVDSTQRQIASMAIQQCTLLSRFILHDMHAQANYARFRLHALRTSGFEAAHAKNPAVISTTLAQQPLPIRQHIERNEDRRRHVQHEADAHHRGQSDVTASEHDRVGGGRQGMKSHDAPTVTANRTGRFGGTTLSTTLMVAVFDATAESPIVPVVATASYPASGSAVSPPNRSPSHSDSPLSSMPAAIAKLPPKSTSVPGKFAE
jgi:hypothetical protein